MDLFEICDQKNETSYPPTKDIQFPNINTKWFPQFEDGINTKVGTSIEKVTDILKKTISFFWIGLGLLVLLFFLPALLRFLYEFSKYLFEKSGSIFP